MSTESARTGAAIQARKNTTELMLQRVRNTLKQMRRDGMPIQTAVVARRAEVSRTFLYQNAEAKRLLTEAAPDSTTTLAAGRQSPADQASPWQDRALNAEDALRAAYAEISNQRRQTGELLGQIRDLEIDLPADAIERITTEKRTLRQENRRLTTDNQQLTDRLKAARENNRFLDTRIARLEAELLQYLGNLPWMTSSNDLPEDPSISVATSAGMFGLWSPEPFAGIHDYDTWEAELLEDDDIERHIRAGALVPIYIRSDGAFGFVVRAGTAAQPAELTDREAGYLTVSSQPYRLQCRDRACLSGIEHIEAHPSEGWVHAIALTAGQYDVTIHLVDWKAEPDAGTADGTPVDGALPDFVVLINPATQDQVTYRTSVQTFDQPA